MGEAFTKGPGIPWDTWNPSGWGVPNGRAAVPALWELRVRRETQRTLIHLQGKSKSLCCAYVLGPRAHADGMLSGLAKAGA